MSHPRTRWARRRALVVLDLALIVPIVTLSVVTSAPVSADPPPGSLAELGFFETDLQTGLGIEVTQGDFGGGTTTYVAPSATDRSNPAAVGCAAGQGVSYAFVSASTDPGAPGSAERPVVTAGSTVESLFEWPADTNIDGYLRTLPFGFGALNVGPRNDSHPLGTTWATGTHLSVVAICTTSGRGDPRTRTVVTAADGAAATSWQSFTTAVSSLDASLTSGGFVSDDFAPAPVVRLTGAPSASGYALSAALTDESGVGLTDATGRVDFSAPGSSTILASAPVDGLGVATVTVPVPAAGTQKVYQATYVPDAQSSALAATSRRFAVVGPAISITPTMSIEAAAKSYGTPVTVAVSVLRGTEAAWGGLEVGLDGVALPPVTLVNGVGSVILPATLAAGAHTIDASYAGTATTGPAAGSGIFTIIPVTSVLSVTADHKRGKKGRPGKTKLAVVLSGVDTEVMPTGKVTASLGRRELDSATADATGALKLVLPDDEVLAKARGDRGGKGRSENSTGPRGRDHEDRVAARKQRVTVTLTYPGGAGYTAAVLSVTLRIRKDQTR